VISWRASGGGNLMGGAERAIPGPSDQASVLSLIAQPAGSSSPRDFMGKTKPHRTVERDDGTFALAREKELLRHYYEGNRLPSPTGEFLMVLRVQPEADGSGSIILECSSSSLRYRLNVNKATRTERAKVREVLEKGGEPRCPRHVNQLLIRVKNDLQCPLCGVRYAKV